MLTGPSGEAAAFDLADGRYTVVTQHPQLVNRRGSPILSKGKFVLNRRRTSVNLSLKLKSIFNPDLSPPILTDGFPTVVNGFKPSMLLNFSVRAADSESQIASVKAKIDENDLGETSSLNGKYQWESLRLPVGNHTVTYTAWNFSGVSATRVVPFVVEPEVGTVTGQISFSGGVVNDATITIGQKNTTTNANGVYSITDVPAGSITIQVSAPGLIGQSRTVNLNVEPKGKSIFDMMVFDLNLNNVRIFSTVSLGVE